MYVNNEIHTPSLIGKMVHLTRSPEARTYNDQASYVEAYGVFQSSKIEDAPWGTRTLSVYLAGHDKPIVRIAEQCQMVVKVL